MQRVRELLIGAALVAYAVVGVVALFGVGAEKREALLEKVEFSGCREVLVGPICEIDGAAQLVVFVRAPADAVLSVRANERARADVKWEAIDGGSRVEVNVSTSTTSIEIVAERSGRDRWRLPIAVRTRPAVLAEADALLRAGKLDDAAAKLDALGDAIDSDKRLDADVENLRGTIASRRSEARGAIDHWRRSAAIGEEAGVVSKSINDRLSAAYMAIVAVRDLPLARSLLEEVRARSLADYAPGEVHLNYYEGQLALYTGDFRSALRAYEEVERSSSRLSLGRTWAFAVQERALIFVSMGLYERARALIDQLLAEARSKNDPCNEAFPTHNLAWAALSAADAGTPLDVDVIATARRAYELFSTTCPDPIQAENARANLALALVQSGAASAAREALAGVDDSKETPPFITMWLRDIDARIDMSEKHFGAALEKYSRLYVLAERAGSPEAAFRALAGRAAALKALGRESAAVAAYIEAERSLEAQQKNIAIADDARTRFLAAHQQTIVSLIDLLSEQNRNDEAIAAARRARLRGVRGLQREMSIASLSSADRSRWEAAVGKYKKLREELDHQVVESWGVADSARHVSETSRKSLEAQLSLALDEALEIAEPRADDTTRNEELVEGELVIGYYPAGRGWIAFAKSPDDAVVARLPADSPPSAFLDVFAKQIDGARRIRFLVDGRLGAIDFHALAFRGAPLAGSREVVYAVDLPLSYAAKRDQRSALLVADARGDLPSARDEATMVERRLEAMDVPVKVLLARDATRNAVSSALARASLFYYCGHGKFGGSSAWTSALLLADSTVLSVGDILELPTAPTEVVLSGCETGQIGELPGDQLGIAQAFVLSGSRTVIAASRPVRDETARAFIEKMSAHLDAPLAAAFQSAQREMIAEMPASDWAAFRVIVP